MSNFESHNNKDGLEDFFSKSLYDGSMQPSKLTWENIESALILEEKRKKRFFWFFLSGFVLLIGTTAAWFVISYNTGPTSMISNKSPKPNEANTRIQTQEHFSNKATISSNSNTISVVTSEQEYDIKNKPNEIKIQLGAFSKKVNEDKFKAIPFIVQSETSEDGITRYFVLSKNVTNDLEAIKAAGFKDAFIKRVNNMGSSSSISMNTRISEKVSHSNKKSASASIPTHNNTSIVASKTEKNIDVTSKKETPINIKNSSVSSKDNELHAVENASVNSSTSKSQTINSSATKEVGASNSNENSATQIANSTSVAPAQTTAQDNNVYSNNNPSPTTVSNNSSSTDSIPKKEATIENKKDSVTSIAKVDSIIKPTQQPIKNDSAKLIPNYRWAISLIGGPNLYLSQAKTQLFDSKTEKQKTTYGGEIKIEYNFIKGLSASIGIGYQSHSIQKDSTRFTFSKYTTNDYVVNSSFGPMAIDNNTLLQGFFMIAPVDSFFAAYKYTSTIQSINIPLQLNWYFLNKSRVKLYSSIGLNTNYIVSQQSHLSLIKEHHVDDIYYKNIQANKINGLLLLSLGCDVRLSKRFYFTLAPSYRYALTNYSKVSGVVFKPSYISASGGFKYRF